MSTQTTLPEKANGKPPQQRQFPTILMALVLAIVVWGISVKQQNPIQNAVVNNISVSIKNLPDGFTRQEESSSQAEVTLRIRAPKSVVESLSPSDFKAWIDLKDAVSGRQDVLVQAQSTVSNVEIIRIEPQAMVVHLEKMVQVSIPVSPSYSGSLPLGYEIEAPLIAPTTVTISGRESLVAEVEKAEVIIDLNDARSSIDAQPLIVLRDKHDAIIRGLTLEPETVSASIPVVQKQGFAEKSILPKKVGQPATNYAITEIEIEPATVTLVGSPTVLEQLPAYVNTVPIDITGATEDVEAFVLLDIPENTSSITIQAATVKFKIKAIEGSRSFTLHPVIQGLGTEFSVEVVSPETIDAILHGPLPVLRRLQNDKTVRAVLDLANLEVGTYTLSPTLVLPEGIEAQTLLPETIEVTIIIKSTPTITPVPNTPSAVPRSTIVPGPTSDQTPTPSS